LSQVQVPKDESVDVLIAVGEAVANAIEHGHRNMPGGVISMDAAAMGDRLHVTITDTGEWKTPESDAKSLRGRGVTLMRGLMEDVTIEPGAAGTTVQLIARIM
jgi:anti-sigma regulatory factor (Ser/Thr protein kinase)